MFKKIVLIVELFTKPGTLPLFMGRKILAALFMLFLRFEVR
jgi:hypothetical protein